MFSGGTGSICYMAPEVMRNESYNESVDIDSFGIIFWQLLTGLIPYHNIYDSKKLYNKIAFKHERPCLDGQYINIPLPFEIQDILTICWSDNYINRLSANEILMKLTAPTFSLF